MLGNTSKTFRSIGGIVAQATLAERHYDMLTITSHPTELGSKISDHAYKEPVEVDLSIGWGGGTFTPLDTIYQHLLDLQASAVPIDIVTGKRQYKNMLITSLSVVTDQDTENALKVDMQCREIIIVQTQIQSLPPASNQANPSATAYPLNGGTVQMTETVLP
ncbi:MAG: hypothetical protein H5T98_01020 [Syntrophomonadaceae bacterium]|nr:hypothetical protein [Syntrophomonadaceae bacterium]